MKRSGPPRRRKGLSADPERVREFMRKRGGALARQGLKRKRPERAPEGPLSPREWRLEAFRLSGGRCVVTGDVARHAFDRRFQAHHPLEKALLPPEHRWDPRNSLWLRSRVHERHTTGAKRVPRGCLPARVWEFAAEMDRLRPGTEWATFAVERAHPESTDERSNDGEG